MTLHPFPTAYDVSQLPTMLDANSDVPRDVAVNARRLVKLARQRADARPSTSALDDTEVECVIATDWTGFARDNFGEDAQGSVNHVAVGVYNHEPSMYNDASLFSDTMVVQSGWLSTGDGRRTQVEQYTSEYSDDGDFWLPDNAQDYVAVIALAPELTHGDPDAAEAM